MIKRAVAFASVLWLWTSGFVQAQENWPQFRGPDGQGHASSRGLPLAWSEQQNVTWKTAIHGRAWSSPVIWGKQVWLTTATEDGQRLYAVCLDRETGRIIFDHELFEVAAPQFAHKFNTYASPTPVMEEGRVYVTFGSPGTACLDTASGKVLWQRTDFICNHFRGAGSSPVLYQDLLLMHFDGSDYQYVVALDKKTGKTVWTTNRSIDFQDLTPEGKPQADGDFRKAFSTPLVTLLEGKPVMISEGSQATYAYDPFSGHELWRVEARKMHSGTARPVVGRGLIFVCTGFSRGELWAIRPAKRGIAKEPEVAWQEKRAVPCKPSVLLLDDLIYMVDDGGIASCVEADTGKIVWQERIGGNYSASPISAEGRLYFFSEEGKAVVLQAGRQFTRLAENALDDGFMASPAVSGRALFLRTRTHLYRIESVQGTKGSGPQAAR